MESERTNDAVAKFALLAAGWVAALENRSGIYVPGPEIRKRKPITRWRVTAAALSEIQKKFDEAKRAPCAPSE